MRIHLNGIGDWPEVGSLERILRRAAGAALRVGGAPRQGELSISFVSDETIRELNRRYLGRDMPTDVLAFDLSERAPAAIAASGPVAGPPDHGVLGDVYIAPDVARRSAEELGISAAEELLRLVVHGVLHVAGQDHPEDESRYESEMFRLQEALVDALRSEEDPRHGTAKGGRATRATPGAAEAPGPGEDA